MRLSSQFWHLASLLWFFSFFCRFFSFLSYCGCQSLLLSFHPASPNPTRRRHSSWRRCTLMYLSHWPSCNSVALYHSLKVCPAHFFADFFLFQKELFGKNCTLTGELEDLHTWFLQPFPGPTNSSYSLSLPPLCKYNTFTGTISDEAVGILN